MYNQKYFFFVKLIFKSAKNLSLNLHLPWDKLMLTLKFNSITSKTRHKTFFFIYVFKTSVLAILPSGRCTKRCAKKTKLITPENGSFTVKHYKLFVQWRLQDFQWQTSFDKNLNWVVSLQKACDLIIKLV